MGNSIDDKLARLIVSCGSVLNDCTDEIDLMKVRTSKEGFREAFKKAKEKLKGDPEGLEILKNFKKNGFKL